MKRIPVVLLLSVACYVPQTAGQAPGAAPPQSLAGVVRLNKVPVSNEVLKVKLPRPVEKQLSNGIKLLVVESHRVPNITLTIRIPTGDLRNPPDLPGLADATAALIRLGTKTSNSQQIAEKLAELGASLNFGSGEDSGTIGVSAMTENFDAALALLTDVLLNPTFPQDEFDKWKNRQKAQLEQLKSQPGFLASEQMYKILYPDDARKTIRLTVASLDKMTRDDVVAHYKKYYVPSGQWAGIAGDITPAEAVAKLEKALGAWKGGPIARITMPMPEPIAEKKVYFIARPNSVQTVLTVANRAIARDSPDYIQCQVMNRVLGAGPSSRLFRKIREEKGYTYGIGSGFSATRVINFFYAQTSVRTDVTAPALTEILKEFRDIREQAVPADELADAKSAIVAGFVLGLESSSAVLSRWMEQREYGFPEDYWDTYSQKVMAVTAADVQAVAKKYVPVDNAQIIAVGDPKVALSPVHPPKIGRRERLPYMGH
jgi:zinc protease